MPAQVFCQKLKKEAVGLAKPPFFGALGQKIFENISQEAWSLWQERQLMWINEYRLNMADSRSREYIMKQMHAFLFEDVEVLAAGYTPIVSPVIPSAEKESDDVLDASTNS